MPLSCEKYAPDNNTKKKKTKNAATIITRYESKFYTFNMQNAIWTWEKEGNCTIHQSDQNPRNRTEIQATEYEYWDENKGNPKLKQNYDA